jgi:hypothetical protein
MANCAMRDIALLRILGVGCKIQHCEIESDQITAVFEKFDIEVQVRPKQPSLVFFDRVLTLATSAQNISVLRLTIS